MRELELTLGHEIHRVSALSDDLVPAAFAQVRVLEAPSSPPGWESRRAMWELMRLHEARTCLGGSWGDQVLVDQSYLVDLFDRLRWLQVWRHLTSYPDWMTDVDRALFRRTFFEDLVRWHVPQPMAGMIRGLRTSAVGVRHDHPWYAQELAFSSWLKGGETAHRWLVECPGSTSESVVPPSLVVGRILHLLERKRCVQCRLG